MASSAAATAATGRLLEAVDDGSLDFGKACELKAEQADLVQGLAYAIGQEDPRRTRACVRAVLALAQDPLSTRLEGEDARDGSSATITGEELLELASRGLWSRVAYHAVAAGDSLAELLLARDSKARRELRRHAGLARVRLPEDQVRETGRDRPGRPRRLQPGAELQVEQPRWMLPRPRREQMFLAADGQRLEEGWYSVVQHPVDDDLREAVLRRVDWNRDRRREASCLLLAVGETLLCKAVKSGQWELVVWLFNADKLDAARLAAQLHEEFVGLWDSLDRHATLRSREDLAELCACLDGEGRLTRPWRDGPLEVCRGAVLRWPRLDTLREALSLGALSMEALQRVGGARATFSIPQSERVRTRWREDLLALEERSFAMPLLNRAVECSALPGDHLGRLDPEECRELLGLLLQAGVSAEVCDAEGWSALAAAASRGLWDTVGKLLEEGCLVDGLSGAMATRAAERASKGGSEEAERAADVLEKMEAQQRRPPARSLAEYFRRQAAGDLVHGVEPRRFELQEGRLKSRAGQQVSAVAAVLDRFTDEHEVLFVPLEADELDAAVAAGVVDLSGRRLLTEARWEGDTVPHAVAVAVPPARLCQGTREGERAVGGAGGGRLALRLPCLARAPPPGGLRVESVTSCCGEPLGRVEIVVDGVPLGETRQKTWGMTVCELELMVPAREMEVKAEICGRRLLCEPCTGGPGESLTIEITMGIYVYVQLVDEENLVENICVCGHRKDVPEDAKPFVGRVAWDGGSKQLTSYEALALGSVECLKKLQSLELTPTLAPGRAFEPEAWVNTGTEEQPACQFERCSVAPVKVGTIRKA